MTPPISRARTHAIPSVVAGLMLLAALGDQPYGFYTALRWVVCAVAVWVAVIAYRFATELPEQQWAWVAVVAYAAIAVLFNPVRPIYMDRGQWAPIDVLAAVALVAGIGLSTPNGPAVTRSADRPPALNAGWHRDPRSPEVLRWWDGHVWTASTVPVSGSTTQSSTGQPTGPVNLPFGGADRRTFPFDQPWSSDWVFWWAVVLMVLSVVAFVLPNIDDSGELVVVGWLIDTAVGIPLNFAIFVLPVAGLRALVRSRRQPARVAVQAPHSLPASRVAPATRSTSSNGVTPAAPAQATTTSPAKAPARARPVQRSTPQTIAVRVDGGQITFARATDGTVTAKARGFTGRPSAATVRRARAAITQSQKKAGQQVWF